VEVRSALQIRRRNAQVGRAESGQGGAVAGGCVSLARRPIRRPQDIGLGRKRPIEGDKLRGSAKIERIEGRGTEAWRDREWEGERVSTHQVGACRVQQADDVSVDTI